MDNEDNIPTVEVKTGFVPLEGVLNICLVDEQLRQLAVYIAEELKKR